MVTSYESTEPKWNEPLPLKSSELGLMVRLKHMEWDECGQSAFIIV